MSYKVGVGPRFQVKYQGERVRAVDGTAVDASRLAAGGEAGWKSDVCLFAFPDHLRLQWWEKVAQEVTSAFYSGVEFEAFVRAILEFAEYKGLPVPAKSEFTLLVGGEALPPHLSAIINLGDAPAFVRLGETPEAPQLKMILQPGEGCSLPVGVAATLDETQAGEDTLVLLGIGRPAAGSVAHVTQEPRLAPGVRVYSCLGPTESAQTRVLLSTGTVTVEEAGVDGFLPGSILPRTPWRRPDEAEARDLWTTSLPGTADSNLILLRIPDSVYAPFRALRTDTLESAEEYAKLRQSDAFKAGVMGVLRYLEEFRQSDAEFEIAWAFSPPGLTTVTMDKTRGKYIGLHFDDWDQLPLTARGLGQNRIVINIGREDRSFLFVNLGVADLVRAVRDAGAEIGEHHSQWRDLVKVFFRCYPNYPVTRVIVKPGEAYIGPTENLIHDGTSLDRETPDVNLQVRGYLWPKEALPTPDRQ